MTTERVADVRSDQPARVALLGTHTDQLTEVLRDAEDALDSLSLGVTAHVPLGPEHVLLWQKQGSSWALVVGTGNGEQQPLLSASRRLRILAVDSLAALHTALLVEHARQDQEVIEATARARSFVAYIRGQREGGAS